MAGIVTRKYFYDSKHIPCGEKAYRVLFLTDLHGKEFGRDNELLIMKIRSLSPDIILIGGDMIIGLRDSDDAGKMKLEVAIRLCKRLCKICPVYYAMGNHEHKPMKRVMITYFHELERAGVELLDDKEIIVDTGHGFKLRLWGLTLEQQWYKKFVRLRLPQSYIKQKERMSLPEDTEGNDLSDTVSILLAHNPKFAKDYAKSGADIILSGHLHGGVVRLPHLGGVIGSDFMLFPKYSGGEYEVGGKKLIVSCGLGSHTIPIRIFNPPELSVLDLS